MAQIIDYDVFHVLRCFDEERRAEAKGHFRWPDDLAPNEAEHLALYDFYELGGILWAKPKC